MTEKCARNLESEMNGKVENFRIYRTRVVRQWVCMRIKISYYENFNGTRRKVGFGVVS